MEDMDPQVARRTWRTLEPLHGLVYFVPEADEEYRAVGLQGDRIGYFASRAAALGPVPAEVVVATFFNFSPVLVRSCIPAAWEQASPAAVLGARFRAVDRALRRGLGGHVGAEPIREAAGLARRAAEAACEHPEGRPLFAGHAALPWPEEPHLVLWHAQTLLREYRGDAHVAALLLDGLTGLEALVVHAATGEVPAPVLRASRGWTRDEWATAVEGLRSRGVLEPGALALTTAGRARRDRVEVRTDELATPAYRALGEDGCARLRELARPLSRAVVDAGLLTPRPGWAGTEP